MTTQLQYGGVRCAISDSGAISYGGLQGQLTGDLTDGTFVLGGLLGTIVGGVVYYGGMVGYIADGVIHFGGLVCAPGSTPTPPPDPGPEFISQGTAVRWDTFDGPKTVQVPPSFAAGDLLVMWTGGSESVNQNTPAGFTLLGAAAAGPKWAVVYGRIADGTETNFSYDPNEFSQGAAVILAFRNMGATVGALAPQVVAPGILLNVEPYRTAAITPAANHTLVFTSASKNTNDPTYVPTTLAGFTVVAIPMGAAGQLAHAMGWAIQTDAAAIPSQDFATTGTPNAGYQYQLAIALKSALS